MTEQGQYFTGYLEMLGRIAFELRRANKILRVCCCEYSLIRKIYNFTTTKFFLSQTGSCMIYCLVLAVINAHNNIRQSGHMSSLRPDSKLRNAAQSHSNRMAQTQQMSHCENINGRRTVGERVHQAGYMWSAVGENVAAGQRTVDHVITSWMNSPGHRQNILNGNYKHIGVGLTQGSNGVYYWCVVFGR
jgi:hypothetical protein